ncbi:MAG TPA: hypothetical protein VKZ18_02385 [Polyangia bacterium]|nr:hypothetical protein [Polyangia bacterium]
MRAPLACLALALSAAGLTAAGAAPLSLGTTRCAGPFPTLEAACPGCVERASLRAPPAPWLEVRVSAQGDFKRPPSRENAVHHYLVVRLPSGWWRQEVGRDVDFEGALTTSWPRPPEARDVLPGTGAELLIEVEQQTRVPTADGEGWSQTDRRTLHLCGVGPSGAPSCTEVETYRFAGGLRAEARDTPVTFNKQSEIVVSGQDGGRPIKPRHYRVDFP